MIEKMLNDTQIYTDVQSLKQLHGEYKKNPDGVKDQMAQQFESLFLQMVLRSMREANKAFASDIFGSNQMEMYEDMYDKQLSLLLSSNGTGFAAEVKKNINMIEAGKISASHKASEPFPMARPSPPPKSPTPTQEHPIAKALTVVAPQPAEQKNKEEPHFATQEEFVKKLWPAAKQAAGMIGANPAVLLAQAALETNWGKKIISDEKNGSSHNLFNIKSSPNWRDKTIPMETLEQKDGIVTKEKADFRSYQSYGDSFMDYIHFLKQNSRYNQAVDAALNPKQFTTALQQAGYATDSHYAEKIWQIFSSKSFKGLIDKMK